MLRTIFKKIGGVLLANSGVLNQISNLNSQINIYFGIFVPTEFKKRVIRFNSLVRPKSLVIRNLCRVGSKFDGGYLIPDDFKKCNKLLSVGLGKNIDFEKEFLKVSKQNSVLGADLTGDIKLKNFLHIRKNIEKKVIDNQTEITVNDFLSQTKIEMGRCILKVDCEGFEVDFFNDIKLDFLKRLRILVIEVHNIPIQLAKNYSNFQKMFKRIQIYFDSVHVHANNGVPLLKLDNVDLINTIEITFVNRKFYKTRNVMNFRGPTLLDMPNIKFLSDHQFTL